MEDIIRLLIPPLGYYEIFKAMYIYYKEVLAVNPYNIPISIINTLLIAGGLTLYLYTNFGCGFTGF